MKYILIHGIGDQDPNLKWFAEALSSTPDIAARFVPFYWEDLREPISEKRLQKLRCFILPTLASITNYSGLLDLMLYSDTESLVFDRLSQLIATIGEDVTLVAHSLGSVLAYRFLQTYQQESDKVARLITLGSPLGRQPVSGRVKPRKLTDVSVEWVNVAGTRDYVTSWLGSGRLKEADYNILVDNSHDLCTYIKLTEYLYE